MHNSGLENAIQDFVERSLNQMSSIDKQLDLLKKFRDILQRESLQEDLVNKYNMVFRLYGEDVLHIQNMYEKNKENPPIPRNMTTCAGRIHWSRQLLRRITTPMKKFQETPRVFQPKESKRIVKLYNKVAKTLIEFESLWFQAWTRSTDQAKIGLRSNICVVDEKGEIHVNFSESVLKLMREAHYLQLMGFTIPNSAQIVLLLEDRLKVYYNRLVHAIDKYKNTVNKIHPVAASLLKPHIADVELVMKPATTSMTWTSMNIDQFLTHLTSVLDRFEFLNIQITDIIEHRIEKNLHFVNTLLLINLNPDKPTILSDFQDEQKLHTERCATALIAKNVEIERAVDDLVNTVLEYPLISSEISTTEQVDINFVKLHYCNRTYHALLNSTKYSLIALKDRVLGITKGDKRNVPLFEVGITLTVPDVVLSPSIADMEDVVQTVARNVLQCTKKNFKIGDWTTAVGHAHQNHFLT
jgi:dynein heavy chain